MFSSVTYLRNGNSCFSFDPPEIDDVSLCTTAATNASDSVVKPVETNADVHLTIKVTTKNNIWEGQRLK